MGDIFPGEYAPVETSNDSVSEPVIVVVAEILTPADAPNATASVAPIAISFFICVFLFLFVLNKFLVTHSGTLSAVTANYSIYPFG